MNQHVQSNWGEKQDKCIWNANDHLLLFKYSFCQLWDLDFYKTSYFQRYILPRMSGVLKFLQWNKNLKKLSHFYIKKINPTTKRQKPELSLSTSVKKPANKWLQLQVSRVLRMRIHSDQTQPCFQSRSHSFYIHFVSLDYLGWFSRKVFILNKHH